MAPGDEPLRQPGHDASGSPEFCVRPRRAGEVASFRLAHYEWVVCGRADGCTSGIAADEANLSERRASQDAAAAPFYRDDCRISACASRLATMAGPAPQDHDEERAGATLRERRASQDAAAAPFYRGGSPRQRRAVASCRPTTPASPRRRRRRRGTTARHGCGPARTSTPTGSSSLEAPEADAGPIASPFPGDDDDDLRYNCCVRWRLHDDEAWQRSHDAEEAGVDEPEANGPTAYAGDVRHSLSAEPDSSMRNGEDIPRRNDSEDDDSSIVVLIETPADGGTLVRWGVSGAAKKAAADIFLADPDRNHFMVRFWLAIELGPVYWVQELVDWMKGSQRHPNKWSWLGVVGQRIQQKDADGGSLVRGRFGGAAMDVFLADPSRDDFMARFTLAVKLGPVYWVQELVDWMKGSQRHPIKWSWLGVVGHRIQQNNDTCAICGTLVCLEARHRLAFERLHGFKTFPYSITTETVTALKNLCEQRGVWTERYGADEQDVLEVIRSTGGCAVAAGVPGWNPCRLQVKSWKYHRNSAWQPMSQSKIAKLIHMDGPILGGIKVDDDWYYAEGWEDSVYRGVPRGYKGADNHLVVCTGYHLLGFEPTADRERGQKRQWHRYGQIETELYIEVVDNQLVDGPVRWILASAFDGFVEVHVDKTELRVKKPSLWRRLLDTVSRIFSLWHGD